MTWKEFKEAVEKQGVTDDTTLAYIDWDDNGVNVILDQNLNDAIIE